METDQFLRVTREVSSSAARMQMKLARTYAVKLGILEGQGPSVDCDVQELRDCYLHMGNCSVL